MASKRNKRVVLIGCGNLAWHLAVQLRSLNHTVAVYNHKASKSLKEFEQLKCSTFSSLKNIDPSADLYLICVSDAAISSVSKKILPSNSKALVVHTSGARNINELKNKSGKKGVCYPLQSFSKNDKINWKLIPLLIEAEDKLTETVLHGFAKSLSPLVKKVNSKDRAYYHLSAVFVNNFVNALHVATENILLKNVKQADPTLLDELSMHTLEKVFHLGARQAQTGPALRKDKETMNIHKKLIRKNKALTSVYRSMSKLIEKQGGEKKL